jgi:uncharacterized DUF497 family protein
MDLVFEWDYNKEKANIQKHHITFAEARTVFWDTLSLSTPDISHSREEDRFLIIGVSERQRLLTVIYTERNRRIRIISARAPTANERESYEEGT